MTSAMVPTVQILGTAPNLGSCPDIAGAERWCAGHYRVYGVRSSVALTTWTRWFNLHSKRHMLRTYPKGYAWYAEQTKPIYLQEVQEDIPASKQFPFQKLYTKFGHRYYTFTGAWLMAYAIEQGFKRIELWGYELRSQQYTTQRPCMFYWIEEARRRGIEVYLPPEVEISEPGDPLSYTGPLYGIQTTEPHFSIEA